MEQLSNKRVLPYKHIATATKEIVSYIHDRKLHKVNSLATRWKKFNNLTMGGIEPNVICSIAGISGSGKSSFVNTLETDLIDLNPKENIVILSFSFEMLSSKQVGRKLSYKLKKTTSELYSSSEYGTISEEAFKDVERESESIVNYPIYYVDSPGTVQEMNNTIQFFTNTLAKDKWLVIIIDHTLLIKGSGSESERGIIVELEKMLMETKKIGKTSIIQISQMNREIERPERINNSSLHYPQRSDISSSDAVFQASDYVFVIHRPEVLGILSYGIQNLPVKDYVYLHCLKNREGSVKILRFINDLKYNNLKEPEEEEEKTT
jgi:replicative DNA helicase